MAKEAKTIDVYGKGDSLDSAQRDLERAVKEAETAYGGLSGPKTEYHVEYGKSVVGVGKTYDDASKMARSLLEGAREKEIVTIKSTYTVGALEPAVVKGSGGGSDRKKESGSLSCYF